MSYRPAGRRATAITQYDRIARRPVPAGRPEGPSGRGPGGPDVPGGGSAPRPVAWPLVIVTEQPPPPGEPGAAPRRQIGMRSSPVRRRGATGSRVPIAAGLAAAALLAVAACGGSGSGASSGPAAPPAKVSLSVVVTPSPGREAGTLDAALRADRGQPPRRGGRLPPATQGEEPVRADPAGHHVPDDRGRPGTGERHRHLLRQARDRDVHPEQRLFRGQVGPARRDVRARALSHPGARPVARPPRRKARARARARARAGRATSARATSAAGTCAGQPAASRPSGRWGSTAARNRRKTPRGPCPRTPGRAARPGRAPAARTSSPP